MIKRRSNTLNKFFKKTRDDEAREKWLLFDAHNLMFRTVFVASQQDPTDEKFTYWKFLMLNSIFRAVQQFKPDKVVMALDSRDYWRKDIYPDYKGQRKVARSKSTIDFEKFFPVADKFWEDLRETLTNFYFTRVDKCEADDIIAVLAREIKPDVNIINISTDKDMYQLMKNKNYQQYDPIKRKIVRSLNPQVDLDMKILQGDSSDNIPSVAPRTGPATAKKILAGGLDNFLINEEVKSNFERNKNLIDFDCIPEHIISKIKKEFGEQELTAYNSRSVYKFLMKNGILRVLEDLQDVIPLIKSVGTNEQISSGYIQSTE
jgi:5'-3' exonuclease